MTVQHLPAEQRFEAVVEGHRSELTYTLADQVMTMTHTYVPGELRGRGIAEKLVRAALAYAEKEEKRVVPACSYVGAFICRHAEFQPLLAR